MNRTCAQRERATYVHVGPALSSRHLRRKHSTGGITSLLPVAVMLVVSCVIGLLWVLSPAPPPTANGGSVSWRASEVDRLEAAANAWIQGFAHQDAGQLADASGAVTRRATRLRLSLVTPQLPRLGVKSAPEGLLRAAVSYLISGVENANPVTVVRGRELLLLAKREA